MKLDELEEIGCFNDCVGFGVLWGGCKYDLSF